MYIVPPSGQQRYCLLDSHPVFLNVSFLTNQPDVDVSQLQASTQQRRPAGQPGRHGRFAQALIGGVEINQQRLQRVADRKQKEVGEGAGLHTGAFLLSYLWGSWRYG